jgi:hypothetical protein
MWAKRFGVWCRSRSHGTARVVEQVSTETHERPVEQAWVKPEAEADVELPASRILAESREPVAQEA